MNAEQWADKLSTAAAYGRNTTVTPTAAEQLATALREAAEWRSRCGYYKGHYRERIDRLREALRAAAPAIRADALSPEDAELVLQVLEEEGLLWARPALEPSDETTPST